jgi:hypothetical protein
LEPPLLTFEDARNKDATFASEGGRWKRPISPYLKCGDLANEIKTRAEYQDAKAVKLRWKDRDICDNDFLHRLTFLLFWQPANIRSFAQQTRPAQRAGL